MVKVTEGRRRFSRDLRWSPYDSPSSPLRADRKESKLKKVSLNLEKKDWEDATCAVCLEYPHNAVLLLCSSHDKGCRPYMCGTSYRHSNCLDQFQKAYTKVMSPRDSSLAENPTLSWPVCKNSALMELACPLCRGQVKGYTVVDPAREYLNNKKRGCMQDKCCFTGTYRELRRHLRKVHPRAKPRKVDPVLEQKWKTLEHQTERADVISTIRSSMPGSVVLGDYVIDMNSSESEGAGNGISGRVLNYILHREGPWLLRLRNTGLFEDREERGGHLFPIDSASTYVSGRNGGGGGGGDYDDDDVSDDMFFYDRRFERRHHQRRRHRTRGRSTSGAR